MRTRFCTSWRTSPPLCNVTTIIVPNAQNLMRWESFSFEEGCASAGRRRRDGGLLLGARKVEETDAFRLPLCRGRRVRADVLLRRFDGEIFQHVHRRAIARRRCASDLASDRLVFVLRRLDLCLWSVCAFGKQRFRYLWPRLLRSRRWK